MSRGGNTAPSTSPISIKFNHDGASQLVEPLFFLKLIRPNDVEEVRCTITNHSEQYVRFEKLNHTCKSSSVEVQVDDGHGVVHGTACNLPPQGPLMVTVKLRFPNQQDCASIQVRLRFDFSGRAVGGCHTAVRYIVCCVIPPQHQETFNRLVALSSHEEQFGFDAEDEDEDRGLTIIWLDDPYDNIKDIPLELLVPLERYKIPKQLKEQLSNCWSSLPAELVIDTEDLHLRGWDNYGDFFHKLLYIEELQIRNDLKAYTIRRATMRRGEGTGGRKAFRVKAEDHGDVAGSNRLFIVKIAGLLEKRPSVLRGDRIFAKPLLDNPEYKYEGEVMYISKDNVFFRFHPRFDDDLRECIDTTKFKIEFRYKPTHMQIMHRAINMVTETERFRQCLFPNRNTANRRTTNEEIHLPFCNEEVRQNAEQKCAVEHIVRGTSGDAPYIIYGPPGTGKTFTLVEAIKQVYRKSKTKSEISIFVCAPTNHAADLVTQGVLKDVPKSDVLRTVAKSRYIDEAGPEVEEVSEEVQQVTKEYVMSKKVVVSTLATCGWLVSGEINHFSHLFIDEAGFAIEPETLIPLVTLDSSKRWQVVLVGDPKQLGPVIRSEVAKKAGLGQSWLERLMLNPDGPYQPNNHRYNPNYVTKLVRNYRSHPDIFQVPNEQFYDKELTAHADVKEREMFCEWRHLPKQALKARFPIIFHGIEGRAEQKRDSPSWFNNYEANCVINYVQKLLLQENERIVTAKQVGVVAPYHRQVKLIRDVIKSSLNIEGVDDLKVGSVEKFQGDEREVIIVSTVRSENYPKAAEHDRVGIGFVADPKRFNVAVTRAKALLIIVGSPIALLQDRHWKKLITFIMDRGGYTGKPTEEELRRALTNQTAAEQSDGEEAAANPRPQRQNRRKNASDYLKYVDDEIGTAE